MMIHLGLPTVGIAIAGSVKAGAKKSLARFGRKAALERGTQWERQGPR